MLRNLKFIKQLHAKDYSVQKAAVSDRKEILRLMQDIFYKTDPSSIYTGVSENPQVSSTMQDMSLESLDENLSFIAKEKESDKTVIGVAINGKRPAVLHPSYMEPLLKRVHSKKEKTLLELWKFVSTMPPDSENYFKDVKEVFEIRYLVVDPSYRNRGIATSLVNTSIKEAGAKGFKFVRVDCTSHFTARIASAAGLDCIYEINYEDYKSPSGEHVFRDVIFPHTKVVVYAGKPLVELLSGEPRARPAQPPELLDPETGSETLVLLQLYHGHGKFNTTRSYR